MTKVVEVRFNEHGKVYFFDPCELDIKKGQYLIVQTAYGIECGKAHSTVKEIDDSKLVAPLRPVQRIANDKDLEDIEENKKLEKKALEICEEKVKEHNLEMSLTNATYTFDRSKVTIYFTADGRVDFRALVKDLAAVLRTRIELHQIGVRDESKYLGGLGACGREFCCSTFLPNFNAVSIKMAKDQGLSLAPGKISGTCGRLMCCLKYEQNSYEYLHKITPKKGAVVMCREGRGTVVDVAILTGKLKVQLDSSPEGLPVVVDRENVTVIRDKIRHGKNNQAENEVE
ncbi:MAG: stage 0 sporulation family protein [Clostridiales bacterium]|nr:stage 0 sporulation family protein [Clostridiales bacterium]